MYESLFWLLSRLGRPFGGIRPRRMTNWLADKAFVGKLPTAEEFHWVHDRNGSELLLHPHYLIDREIIAFGTYDPQINDFIARHVKPGMSCLDVGANIGVMTLNLASQVGPTGRVHSFEPVPHLSQRLQKHVERNRLTDIVRVHRLALSDRAGTVAIHVADEGQPNQGMGSLVFADHVKVRNEIPIEAITLDEFVKRESIDRIDFIKIDIQGAEPLFFRGGSESLSRFKPDLLVEVSPIELSGCGSSSRDLICQISDLGYELFEMTQTGRVGERIAIDNVPENYSSNAVFGRARSA
ncbi:MAG TPA: FkbM family methyltransferase [Fimbriiglobus sp.]|jgi:FkbM family methyltransferase